MLSAMSEAAEPVNQPERNSTAVPPRAGKSGRRPAAARPVQKQKASQLRQARARRNRIWAVASVAVVVVVVAILVAVAATGGSGSGGPPREPAPQAAVAHITSIPVN